MSSAETAEQDITSLVETRAALANGHVRELRKRARLTQRELARALNVSPPTVSRWESQLRQPRGEAAKRLADIVRLLERLSDPESAKPAVAGSKASRGSSTSDKSS